MVDRAWCVVVTPLALFAAFLVERDRVLGSALSLGLGADTH
jgi:sirohydrochlorin ferrochelatase